MASSTTSNFAFLGQQRPITHADELRAQRVVRLRNLLRRAARLAGQRPDIRSALDELALLAGSDAGTLADGLKQLSLQNLQALVQAHGERLAGLLTVTEPGTGVDRVVSQHADVLLAVQHGWGAYSRPEDCLGAFQRLIQGKVKHIAALQIVLTRPRDLTASTCVR